MYEMAVSVSPFWYSTSPRRCKASGWVGCWPMICLFYEGRAHGRKAKEEVSTQGPQPFTAGNDICVISVDLHASLNALCYVFWNAIGYQV